MIHKFKVGDILVHNPNKFKTSTYGRIWKVHSTNGYNNGYMLELISAKRDGAFKIGLSYSFSQEFVESFYILIDDVDAVTLSL